MLVLILFLAIVWVILGGLILSIARACAVIGICILAILIVKLWIILAEVILWIVGACAIIGGIIYFIRTGKSSQCPCCRKWLALKVVRKHT
jgi:hypothetical protein